LKKKATKRNPWGSHKVPVHGNVDPETAEELAKLKQLYKLKSMTEALNMVIAEGLAVYKTRKEKADENQAK
jgi:hypothetical protein